MVRDFTLDTYKELCKAILSSNFTPTTVYDYLSSKNNTKKMAIIRHDVDARPGNALKMAKIEANLKIHSTYYFRTVRKVRNEEIIREICNLGHEIGYHYEVLARSKGDKKKAVRLFEKELDRLRDLVKINTICMHGSPLSKWKDSDLWIDYNFEDYGIIGEAFLSLKYDTIHYYTDTGDKWDANSSNIRDKVESILETRPAKSTFDLIRLLPHLDKSISINSHPHRWDDDLIPWSYQRVSQKIKNMGKKLFLKNKI